MDMYNIGIISSNTKLDDSTYIEALKETKCNVHYLKDKQKWNITMDELDALIIEEAETENQMSIVCESIIKIREQTSALLWVLSKNKDKSARIVYMKLGADGIINTSIDSDELSLFVCGSLRRFAEKKQKVYEEQVNPLFQELTMPKKKVELIHSNFSVLLNGNQEVSLTKLEFRTIELLSNHAGQALTYEEIYKNVWSGEDEDKQYRVANIIYHLRRKLEGDDSTNEYIRTIRSKGYMLIT
ncbi:response regulator transcription factor [Candidatus Enterococcus ikei]|uniref:Response regulator transcription factor n=1 Tax=Candidatus Enterococcus ikei TaxID=2815326 RepID=A0ABS3H0R0_9ENTE|nr:winged helix-turn-helix domain-containing protein [Enterococcus sp. DIV0869a]MBO0441109.1 response regulator transcription factor [Enterococcus sp. DIV0869a]